jgi:hypothetical protein
MEYRTQLVEDISSTLDAINENDKRIDTIKTTLDSEELKKEEIDTLLNEKQYLEHDNEDLRQDLGILEEMLHTFDMNNQEDDRSCSPYEERYDGWDEVFTGGDY